MNIFKRNFKKSVYEVLKSHGETMDSGFKSHGEMILTLNRDYLKLLDKSIKLEARIKELEEKQNS